MKILLVNTDLPERKNANTLPLAMYFIAGLLRNNEFDVEVLDPMLYRKKFFTNSIYDDLMSKCRGVEVVCFSANSFSLGYILKLVRFIRKEGYVNKIIIGGVHTTHYPENIVDTEDVDYVVIGEAEISLVKLIENIKNGLDLPVENVLSKSNRYITLKKTYDISKIKRENYIFPAYDLVPQNAYETITIETSRGCYGNCSFCSIASKTCWKSYPLEYIIENIKKAVPSINKNFTHKSICFTDDCFTTNISRAVNLLEEFSNMEIREYKMLIEARLFQLKNKDLMEKVKKLPNILVQVGIECGYNSGLKRINKGITKEQIIECSEIFYKEGISKKIFYSFIIGFPWETEDDMNKTLELMCFLKNKFGIAVNCSWWIPVPSVEFEYLKRLNPNVDNSIFKKNGWVNNSSLFYKTHPQIDELTFYNITRKILNENLSIGEE